MLIGIDVNNIIEEWKPLVYDDLDLTNRFLISNTGKLYSLISNKILKTHIHKGGYEIVCVSLGEAKKKKVLRIHKCVAQMFVEGYDKNKYVNHIDGNKTNNIYTNLEWVTAKENMKHAANNNLLNIIAKKPIKQIDKNTGEVIHIYESIAEATRTLGNSKSKNLSGNISEAIRKRNKTAYGYKWELVE